MPKANHSLLSFHRVLVLLLTSLALVLSCSAPVPKPTGPAADYQDAKDMFKRSRFDRALEFSDGLATATSGYKIHRTGASAPRGDFHRPAPELQGAG